MAAILRSLPLVRALLPRGPDWASYPGFTGLRSIRFARALGPRAFADPEYGTGFIRSTVAKHVDGAPNVPLGRMVRCIREMDGRVVQQTWSNPVTGAYAFEQLPLQFTYTVIAYDYQHGYRAAVADNLTPTKA